MIKRTDNDIFVMENINWKVTAFYYSPLTVDPPRVNNDLFIYREPDAYIVSQFRFILPTGVRYIDPKNHKKLLDTGLEKYKDLWKALAKV